MSAKRSNFGYYKYIYQEKYDNGVTIVKQVITKGNYI